MPFLKLLTVTNRMAEQTTFSNLIIFLHLAVKSLEEFDSLF